MVPIYSHLVLTALCSPLPHLPGLVFITNSIWQNDGMSLLRVSYQRLRLPSWALSHLPPLSDHSVSGRQVAMLLTAWCRGPHSEEQRTLANSQQGREALQPTTQVTLEFSKILQPLLRLEMTTALTNSLTATSSATPSQKHSTKPLPDT